MGSTFKRASRSAPRCGCKLTNYFSFFASFAALA